MMKRIKYSEEFSRSKKQELSLIEFSKASWFIEEWFLMISCFIYRNQ